MKSDVKRRPRLPFLPAFRDEVLRIGGKHFPTTFNQSGAAALHYRLLAWERNATPRECAIVASGDLKVPPPDCTCSGCRDALAFLFFDSINQQFGNGEEYLRLRQDQEKRILYEASFSEGKRTQ
jgi:hypothetical protein